MWLNVILHEILFSACKRYGSRSQNQVHNNNSMAAANQIIPRGFDDNLLQFEEWDSIRSRIPRKFNHVANEAMVSFRVETRANSKNIGINTNISAHIFHNHRLRLWYKGRCIDSSDGEKLTVQFCDPDLQQVRLSDNVCFFH